MKHLWIGVLGTAVLLGLASPAWAFGWYLMVPPVRLNGASVYYDASQPLKAWLIRKSYDTAFGCERALDTERAKLRRDVDRENCDDAQDAAPDCNQTVGDYNAANSSRCVASDDPRLKP